MSAEGGVNEGRLPACPRKVVASNRLRWAVIVQVSAAGWLLFWVMALARGGWSVLSATIGYPAQMGIALLGIVGMGVGVIMHSREVRRLRAFALEHSLMLCTRCHYPIAEPEESGRCAECGCRYDRKSTLEAWRRFVGPGNASVRER